MAMCYSNLDAMIQLACYLNIPISPMDDPMSIQTAGRSSVDLVVSIQTPLSDILFPSTLWYKFLHEASAIM